MSIKNQYSFFLLSIRSKCDIISIRNFNDDEFEKFINRLLIDILENNE